MLLEYKLRFSSSLKLMNSFFFCDLTALPSKLDHKTTAKKQASMFKKNG